MRQPDSFRRLNAFSRSARCLGCGAEPHVCFTARDENRSLGEILRRLGCEVSDLMVWKIAKSGDLQKEYRTFACTCLPGKKRYWL